MRKLLTSLGVAAAAITMSAVPASAGGWVVVSLDSAPVVHPEEDTTIGFTVLRHGVTPENSDAMTLVVTDESGRQERFEVIQQGAVGHHVATIRVAEAGSYSWALLGPFIDYDLGALEVSGSSDSAAMWRWDVFQWAAAAVGVVMAALAIVELRRTRTRPAHPTVAA